MSSATGPVRDGVPPVITRGPRTAVVLAAGSGLGSHHSALAQPAALRRVGRRVLLDWALDELAAAGVATALVGVDDRDGRVADHLGSRTAPFVELVQAQGPDDIVGCLRRSLADRMDDPVFVLDFRTLRLDGPSPALDRLTRLWDPNEMDALLLLMPTAKGIGLPDRGELLLDPLGRARLPKPHEIAPYIYASAQILCPRVLASAPDGSFQLDGLWPSLAQRGRLWGVVHDGACLSIASPEALAMADDLLDERWARWVEP